MTAQTPKTAYDVFTFYLSPSHITEPRTVTIEKVEIKELYSSFEGQSVPAMIVHFHKARRVLKLNKTQALALMDITGTDDHTKWAGTTVTLSKVKIKGGKETIKIEKAPPASEA